MGHLGQVIRGLPDKAVIDDLKAFNEQCLNVSSASSGRRMLQSEDSAPEVTQCDDGTPRDHRWTLGLRRPNKLITLESCTIITAVLDGFLLKISRVVVGAGAKPAWAEPSGCRSRRDCLEAVREGHLDNTRWLLLLVVLLEGGVLFGAYT